ncbi:DUF2946 family protein [Pigmentiphaga sp.]|uniref:DUF2946 family protein n=1 Tax=Pigmentiphaga sp. TaxID=1977564 RepID=UPI0025E674B5|nr:DUF2946 family protein [Pigmentiphaga sp.]
MHRPSLRFVRQDFHRGYAMLVLLALLWGMLAPAIANTLARPSDTWVELCSVYGPKLIKLSDDGSRPSPDDSATTSADCPYCRLHAAVALPSPGGGPVLVGLVVSAEAPALPPAPLLGTAPISRPPPSRAPPLTSAS